MSKLLATKNVEGVAARWESQLEELRSQRRKLAGGLLQYHFDVGRLATEIIEREAGGDSRSPYGKQVVETIIARRLDTNRDTIYRCVRFARQTTPEKLEELKELELPWRTVESTMALKEPETRDRFRKGFAEGKYQNSDELKRAVAEHNAEEKRKMAEKKASARTPRYRPGAGEVLNKIRSFNITLGRAVSQIIPQYLDALDQLAEDGDRFNPATVQKIAAELKESSKISSALVRLTPRLTEETKVARAKKVKAEAVRRRARAG